MSLITLAADDVYEYYGDLIPAYARLYANMDFRTSEGVFVAKGSPTSGSGFFQQFTASMVGVKIRIATGDAYSTSDSIDKPSATYSLVVYDAAGTKIKTVFSNLRIPPTNSTTTWANVQLFSAGKRANQPSTYLSSSEILGIFGQIVNGATKASEVQSGVGRLNQAATVLNDPVFLGPNDTIVTGLQSNITGLQASVTALGTSKQNTLVSGTNIKTLGNASLLGAGDIPLSFVGLADPTFAAVNQTKFLSAYASLAAALTAIGATPTELKVTSALTVPTTATIPSTTKLVFEGNGKLTVAAGQTLTIGNMADPGNRQVLVQTDATANIRFAKGAVQKMNVAWIHGQTPTNCTNAINQYVATATANSGGVIYIPEGLWTTAGDHLLTSNTVIEGSGMATTGAGTTLQLNRITSSHFVVNELKNNITFRKITLDGNNQAATNGVLCSGAGGASTTTNNIAFQSVKFTRLTHGFRLLSTGGWQVAAISFDPFCQFDSNTHSGIRCNSVNNAFSIAANFYVGGGAWATYFENSGAVSFWGCEFAGPGGYLGANQVEQQTVVAAAGITTSGLGISTVTHPSLNGGAAFDVYVALTTAEHTTASLIAAAFRTALAADDKVGSAFHVTGTGADIQLISLDPAANVAAINFTVGNATGVGITANATSTTTTTGVSDVGMAEGVCYTNGAHGTINFFSTQDEGFRTHTQVDAGDQGSFFNFYGGLIQAPIRLNETTRVNLDGVSCNAKVIREGGGSPVITAKGNHVQPFIYAAGGGTLAVEGRLTNFSGTKGAIIAQEVDTDAYLVRQGVAGLIYENSVSFAAPTTDPMLSILSYRDKNLLRIGNGTERGIATAYYDFKRNNAGANLGRFQITGSQPTIAGYDFNGDIYGIGSIRGGAKVLTYAATVTANPKDSNYFVITLTGNLTLAMGVLTDVADDYQKTRADGQVITFELVQDATGSRLLTLGTGAGQYAYGTEFPAPTLTTTAAKRDLLEFKYSKRADRWIHTGIVKNIS